MPYGAERKAAWERLNPLIGKANQQLIDQSNLIFAVLDGVDVDSGTAAEIGSGFAKGKKIIGYRGDFSLSADNEGSIVNLQVEYFIEASGGAIVTRLHGRRLSPISASSSANRGSGDKIECKRSAEALQIVCAESCEHRKKSHLLQGCSQWTTIRTT